MHSVSIPELRLSYLSFILDLGLDFNPDSSTSIPIPYPDSDFDFGPVGILVPVRFLYSFYCSIPSMTSFHVILSVPVMWHLLYIESPPTGDPHPFLFGSPAGMFVCIRLP